MESQRVERNLRSHLAVAVSLAAMLIAGCAPEALPSGPGLQAEITTPTRPPIPATPARSTPTLIPQATATFASFGPEADLFPGNINPMTGLPVIDPALLEIPTVLVSISHFPASGRPQAGLSFAPFVYEFSITRGETRFLTAFYGQFPEPEAPTMGDCPVRFGVFPQTGVLVGNRVWLDTNRNGSQDPGEKGIPGICVSLRDARGIMLQETTTDTNGIFGFNVEAHGDYRLEFAQPAHLRFTAPDVGNDDSDSDVDPFTGATPVFSGQAASLDWDAGMILAHAAGSTIPTAGTPHPAEVGPVRSGRLLYAYLAESYTNSCLIYAFASPEVLSKLPHCAFVAHEEAAGGDMISIARMRSVAEDNMLHTAARPFNYSSNVYSEIPPPGGVLGSELNVFFGHLNQSGWRYDPLYKAYLRYVDSADPATAGLLHPDTDRLTGRQLYFENVVVIMVDADVISPTNIDIHLEAGNTGPAMLFRNGQMHSIAWSTRGGEYERQSGLRRPIQFLNPDGSSAALKPGHTWVIIVTPYSSFESQDNGAFLVKYGPPAGEAE